MTTGIENISEASVFGEYPKIVTDCSAKALSIDRTPLDCWLYQKQFVEMLEAEYGPREQFMDEFNIDICIGTVPWPNQLGHRIAVTELADVELGKGDDPQWLTHTDWNPDFAGLNVTDAVRIHGDSRAITAHMWGMVEGAAGTGPRYPTTRRESHENDGPPDR